MNERAGQELSAEARQLIANARGADDPTAEDEARIKARWLAGIAAGAGVSSLSEAVRAAASTGWSWGLKAALLAGAAAVAAVGMYLGWPEAETPRAEAPVAPRAITPRGTAPQGTASQRTAPNGGEPAEALAGHEQPADIPAPAMPQATAQPPQVVAAEAPAASPVPGEPEPRAPGETVVAEGSAGEAAEEVAATPGDAPPAAVAPPAVTPAAKRAPSARQARSPASRPKASTRKPVPAAQTPAEAPASPASGQLSEEIARLSAIRGQLQAGSATRALELLKEYRSRFAEPNLAMEADALQVDALCKAGKREAAREAAAAFASRWPGSPLQQRVDDTCE